MSLFSSSRCVLMLADDGLHIYRVSSLSARYIEFVLWTDENFVKKVTSLIVTKCGRKPVVILNDMVEQHYRKEKLPKTSVMDRNAVKSRRLAMAFPNYPIRAALKLKEVDTSGPTGGTYLFASIPQSDSYKKTIAAVRQSGAPIKGLCLLPVESTTMVKALAQKQSKQAKTRSAWSIFVGQHHGGGLRQVVIKRDDLALTRMTPVVDTDVEPDVWVKEVSAELQSTMSYLSRFGYKSSDGLDIFVVANQNTQSLLAQRVDIESNLYCLDVSEMASMLGLKIGKQDDLRYADALHAAWIGKQRAFALSMASKTLEGLTRPRQIANGIALLLFLGCAALSSLVFSTWGKNAKMADSLVNVVSEATSLNADYTEEKAKYTIEGYNYLLVNNAIEIHESLALKKTRIFSVLRGLSENLGPNLAIEKIDFKLVAPSAADFGGQYGFSGGYDEDSSRNDMQGDLLLQSTVNLSFGDNVDTDAAVNKIVELSGDLRNRFTDSTVAIDKQVGGVSYSESFAEEIGVDASTGASQGSKSAVIIIKEKVPDTSDGGGY